MSRMKPRITQGRAAVIRRAVFIIGGQEKMADKLQVTQATVSRWCRQLGPIPEAAFLWARTIIEIEDKIAAEERE